jgi:hypothetical protein
MGNWKIVSDIARLITFDNNRVVLDCKKQSLKGRNRKISMFDERKAKIYINVVLII